ncbi:hypothetical protein [Ruegeria sp. Ofav3-42]|uniref:hypothetical protein n=1 Tax=Ruegeria sp. Ofav3-42 TaxID=2917759 RepID=UPI001EF419A6|nr:hypothetical protein [Ruegeria sp. Ofav3-42]MCG7520749.1 hypothetical protein [Ruegeria sp. Ofav3-42]
MASSRLNKGLLIGIFFALLPGCGSKAQDQDTVPDTASQTDVSSSASSSAATGIDPATYAGRFQIKLTKEVPLRDIPVPFTVYGGLEESSPTRLRLRAFMDLRGLQEKAPQILTGPLEESCKRQIYLEVRDVTAIDDTVKVEGSARAQFTRCTRQEEPGFRYFGATVDAVAVAKAKVEGQCLTFSIESVDLSPRGFIGGVSNLFGLTNRINEAVLEKGGEFLASHPVCPPLPEEFSVLDPIYESGGTREIAPGGMGAAVVGSADVSAETIVKVLGALKELGVLEFAE